MIRTFRLLLLPFSLLYGLVVVLRNKLYDWHLFGSTQFDIPVICVGNLVVGGSGKSPVTEYLVNLFSDRKIAILSRGYGRETKGFILAGPQATAKSIGDEPLQFYHKFPEVTVAVCEDRVAGIEKLKYTHDLILLDDAFQHRRLRPGFSILLFEFQKLQHFQFLLPAGNLREPFRGYKRADLLLVTKAPEQISIQQKQTCTAKFDKSALERLYFSSLAYGKLHSLNAEKDMEADLHSVKTVFLLTGIANPAPMLEHLRKFTTDIIHHDYPDHHHYSSQNIIRLVHEFQQHPAKEKIIITTEKDAQRLFDVTIKELLLNLPVFYLPIQIMLEADRKKEFDQKILNYVSDTTRNR
jgi:tetraacyldisaccharide 4'-kinase